MLDPYRAAAAALAIRTPTCTPSAVLAFATSDPTGAGGVLADLLACAAMGCHVACAITGVVVQDSRCVEGTCWSSMTNGPTIRRGALRDVGVRNESVERVDLSFRGAGDTLLAALAALLAQGIDVGDAVREANEFRERALAGGFRLGRGDAVPDARSWPTTTPPAPDDDDAR